MSLRCLGLILALLAASGSAAAQEPPSALKPFLPAAVPHPAILQPFIYAGAAQPVEWSPPKVVRDGPLPIDLPTALKLVNARSRDIAIAAHRINQAGAALELAKYVWLPNISIGPDY